MPNAADTFTNSFAAGEKLVIARRAFFSAGRVLRRADWSDAVNREVYSKDFFPHGHDYLLSVFYQGTPREEDGMIVNISEIKPILARILEPLDDAFLNDLPAFKDRAPTLENLIEYLWNQLPSRIEDGVLARLCLQESDKFWAQKFADSHTADSHTANSQIMKLTRKYEFAAAHRLHAPTLSEEENSSRYGKCNNIAGHGHNYGLEVTIEGEPNADSGVLIAPAELDAIVEKEVFERFDHKHLNVDCPEFQNLIPTSENLARVIFEKLQPALKTDSRRLAKIGLNETQKNYFEVEAA